MRGGATLVLPAALLSERCAQIEQVTKRHERNADQRQNKLFISMRNGQCAAHKGQPHHRNDEWRSSAMFDRAPTNSDRRHNQCQRKAKAMNFRGQQEMTSQAKARHHDQSDDAMDRAQTRNPDTKLIEAAAAVANGRI